MKVLVSSKCGHCGKPILIEVEEQELSQGRELQLWILRNLTICKECFDKGEKKRR